MSGGRYDYAYHHVDNFVDDIMNMWEKFPETKTELRVEFVKHLRKVSQAMHDIEWVDSGDCSPGDEDKSIRECLK